MGAGEESWEERGPERPVEWVVGRSGVRGGGGCGKAEEEAVGGVVVAEAACVVCVKGEGGRGGSPSAESLGDLELDFVCGG